MAYSIINTGTDGTISVTGLVLEPAGTTVTGATVLGTLRDVNNAVVTNWNGVSLSDQGGGTYTFNFSAANVPPVGDYFFTVVVTKSGLTLTVEHDVIVQVLSA